MTNESTSESGAAAEYEPEHTPRLAWAKHAPEVYQAMSGLEAASRKGGDPKIAELVKTRVSQINHCAFCLDMHAKDALAGGESIERLVQLSAWEESRHFYTARELAALELAEAVTLLADGGVPDEVWEQAAEHFDEAELAQLLSVIAVINTWNRFQVATRAVPGHYKPGQHRM